jgi:hypothetical protein
MALLVSYLANKPENYFFIFVKELNHCRVPAALSWLADGQMTSNGKRLLRDGKPTFKEAFLKDSNRNISLAGDKKLKEAKTKSQA